MYETVASERNNVKMRGIYTPVTKIRRQIFKKVAELAYSGDFSHVDEIPYEIIPGEVASYRESVFKERAIVAERIRLACGLNVRTAAEHAPILGMPFPRNGSLKLRWSM